MYKTIGKITLTFNELEEVLSDLKQTMNCWPFSYIEDDIELPKLTPNLLVFEIHSHIPTMDNKHDITDKDLKKKLSGLTNI